MALALFDRVQETTTTTGTGSVTLGGAVPGFQTFAVVGNGNTCYYTIVDGSAWEVGVGTYSTSGPTLARTTILSNSNGNVSPITLTAGTKSVFLTYPAGKSVNLNESGNVSPLGTVVSGIWNGTTIGVAYGGTGVTASSGANSVVLRDSNQNITVNRINQGIQTITASGGTTVLTAASQFNQALVGTGGQTFRLPDATTLTDTTTFQFNNNATGTLTIQNNAGTTVGSIASGGAAGIALLSNATVGGTWDVHAYIPESVTWGTNALTLGSTVISGGTWQGGTIATGYGGTGLTSYTSGGAVYANSSSTLTSGTLPLTAGGTAATSAAGARTSLDVPSTTGSGASGTWGINISGNAATATTATSATTATTATNQSGGTVNATTMTSSGRYTRNTTGGINSPSSRFALTTSQQADYHIASSVNGASPTNTQEYGITFSPSGGSTQAGILISENGSDGTAIGFFCTNSYAAGPQLRASIDPVGNFNTAGAISQNGSQVLTAANYNSYAPTLTGGGASGTWGINITGSAGSAPGYLPLSGGTMTGSLAFAQSANINFGSSTNEAGPWTISVIGSGGATPATKGTGYGRNLIVKAGNSDNGGGLAGGDLYLRAGAPTAPATTYGVVYLSDDGGFTQAGGSLRAPIFYDSNNTAYYVDPNSTGTSMNAAGNVTIGNGGANTGLFVNYGGGSGDYAVIGRCYQAGSNNQTIHVFSTAWQGGTLQSTSAGSINLSGANGVTMGAWNNNDMWIDISGNSQSRTSSRAPIFYDSNNTAYFTDPASRSRQATIDFGNAGYYIGPGDWGMRNTTPDGWIQFGPANTSHAHIYTDRSNFYFNAQIQVNGGSLINTSDIRAGVFYDVNNTSYYLDPNSITSLRTVGSWRADSSTWDGEFPGKMQYHSNNWYLQYAGSMLFRNPSGTNVMDCNTSGDLTVNSSSRAPIFYDSNNTAYYVNPNSSSQLSSVFANDYFRAQGSTGLYLQDYAYYFDRNPDVYGNWRCGVNPQNSYVGITYAYSSSRATTMFDSTGNGGLFNYSYWIYYWLVGNACLGIRTSSTSSAYAIYVDGGIYSTGNITAYSDVRKKREIVTVDNALATVNKLRGVFYKRIETNDEKVDPNKRQIGVIAQEVNEVLPEAVTYAKDVDEYGVQYGNMAGLFIEAIKELTAKIDALEQRIAA